VLRGIRSPWVVPSVCVTLLTRFRVLFGFEAAVILLDQRRLGYLITQVTGDWQVQIISELQVTRKLQPN